MPKIIQKKICKWKFVVDETGEKYKTECLGIELWAKAKLSGRFFCPFCGGRIEAVVE
jgi:hypothetical protein